MEDGDVETLKRETAVLRSRVTALMGIVQMLILHVLPDDPAERKRIALEMADTIAIDATDMPRQSRQIALEFMKRFAEEE